jgi:fructokinase
MTSFPALYIFGEVLFDCFPGGEQILGGAPFNVAWHLQALGDRPQMISRVGADAPGRKILQAMTDWGMDRSGVQCDAKHPTGQVRVELVDREPHYDIVPNCAYDFISAEQLPSVDASGLLYHGSLGLRNSISRSALTRLQQSSDLAIFLDVNLRAPWWQIEAVQSWLNAARWVKLNHDELQQLGFVADDPEQAVATFQERFELEQVILTRGAAGALVRTAAGKVQQLAPEPVLRFVDTVGAGDAFSAVYIHGLRAGWPIAATLAAAQHFASQVVGLRGATTADPAFYQNFIATLPPA